MNSINRYKSKIVWNDCVVRDKQKQKQLHNCFFATFLSNTVRLLQRICTTLYILLTILLTENISFVISFCTVSRNFQFILLYCYLFSHLLSIFYLSCSCHTYNSSLHLLIIRIRFQSHGY